MKPPTLFVATVLVLATVAYAAEIRSDYDRSANLSDLKSFRFEQTQRRASDPLAHNELVDKRLRNALKQSLEGMGLTEDATSDFTISYRAAIQKQLRVTTSGTGPWRWNGGQAWADEVYEGTVIVDFENAKTGELVWRGYVTTTLGNPEKSEARINKDIKKLIERFAKDRKNRN
jgi:hypothetical protein